VAKGKRLKGVKPKTSVRRAMEAAFAPRVADVLGFEDAVRGNDVDGVHDMRVAVKRLRETARLFRPAFGKARMAGHLEHMERLNDALGAVREIDVLGLHIRNIGDREDVGAEELKPLADLLSSQRADANRALLTLLDQTLPFLEQDFQELLLDCCKKRKPVWKMPFAKLAGDVVSKRLDQALALETAARAPGAVAEFHRMRIAVKRARYALELSLGVMGKTAARLCKGLAKLQDVTGETHDCDVLLRVLQTSGAAILCPETVARASRAIEADRAAFRDEALALLDKIHAKRLPGKLRASL